MELTVEELNELLQKEFERGKNSITPNIVLTQPDINNLLKESTIANTNNACQVCPKNPLNGGDGICNCTLGDMKVIA